VYSCPSFDILLNDLDLGEAQTIVLAKELNADVVLIDETIGYNLAKSQELNVQRTLSLLIAFKQKGHIEAVKPLLDDMIRKGRWISRSVRDDALRFCAEV
jgi:predicted nucleic acid-binding protein